MGLYLVTGAGGFIGSALAGRLLNEGHEVVTIDNLSTGYRQNIPDGVDYYIGDCQDEAIYQKIPQCHYDAIFHMAGQSSGEISFDDPIYDLRTNTESTLHLLKFALKMQCNRIIYASSMSVYGDYLAGPVKESALPAPKSFYAIGKLASENYLQLYEQYGIHSTSLRFFNVYGPGQNLANLRQGMISIYLAQIIKNNHVIVQGEGQRFRDFVYIDDVIDACIASLRITQSSSQIINIGSGVKTTVESLINLLTTNYNKPITIEYKGHTLGDIYGVYADINLAKDILNFRPKWQLQEGIISMLDWASRKAI